MHVQAAFQMQGIIAKKTPLLKEAMLVIVHVSRLATIRIAIITRGSTINSMFPVFDFEMLVYLLLCRICRAGHLEYEEQ